MEQELLLPSEHLNSPRFLAGFVFLYFFCVMFCRSLFVMFSFSFDHCIVSPSSIYDFCLPLWYLQTVLPDNQSNRWNITVYLMRKYIGFTLAICKILAFLCALSFWFRVYYFTMTIQHFTATNIHLLPPYLIP